MAIATGGALVFEVEAVDPLRISGATAPSGGEMTALTPGKSGGGRDPRLPGGPGLLPSALIGEDLPVLDAGLELGRAGDDDCVRPCDGAISV
jgi:hypothetical protein